MTKLRTALNHRLAGVICAFGGISLFSAQDLIIKHLSADYSLMQLMFFRSMSALPTLVLVALCFGGLSTLLPRNLGLLATRSVIQVFSYTFYVLGIASLQFGNAVALAASSPIWVALLGALLLREPIGIGQWLLILAGFVGALFIAWPDSGVFQLGATFSLLAALSYATMQLFVRKLAVHNSALAIVLAAHLTFLMVSICAGIMFGNGIYGFEIPSLAFLTRRWASPVPVDLLLISSCGILHAIAAVLLTQGYMLARASTLAPIEYVSLFWAVIWGYAIWQEVPSAISVSGMFIIAIVGVCLLRKKYLGFKSESLS